jgi:anti-sigma factor RsiW
MESSKREDEKLQMFFDGELPSEEEAEVRRRLDDSPEQTRRLAEWEQIRGAMKRVSASWTDEIDSDALFARIEAQLELDDATPAAKNETRLRIVPGGRERRVWSGVATGLAAAAAILLAVLTWPGDRAPEMARGSRVLEVDFGEYAGTVFEVEGGAGQPLSVVWISDEEVAIP